MDRKEYFSILIDDRLVSFNFNRTIWEQKTSERRAIFCNQSDSVKKLIIPGVEEKTEKKLLEQIYWYQNKRLVKKHSFSIAPHMFSLQWRVSAGPDFEVFVEKKDGVAVVYLPLTGKTRKKIDRTIDKYKDKLERALIPGTVFLVPDREVNFADPRRSKRPYSRPVLIASCTERQVTIIPFTTKVKFLDRDFDILFDSSCETADLRPEASPAIENFPYESFSKPVLLKVGMAQPVSRRYFIETSLLPVGPVTNQLLKVVHQRMGRKETDN